MARKLDVVMPEDAPGEPLTYREDLVASLIRVIAVWTSPSYQRGFAATLDIPEGDNAIAALHRLASGGPQRPSELTTVLQISPPVMSRLLDSLAKAGLTRRLADPRDSRASLVALTRQGRLVATRLFEEGDAMVLTLLDEWSPTDRELFARLLSRFADTVERDANRRQRALIPHPGVTN